MKITTNLTRHNKLSEVESFLHERDIDELRQIHAEYVRPLNRAEMMEQIIAIEPYLIERLHDREGLGSPPQSEDDEAENRSFEQQRSSK